MGEQTVSSGLTGVLNATTPLWTLLMALLMGVERRLVPPKLTGLVVGLAGTLLIFAPWQESGLLSWGASRPRRATGSSSSTRASTGASPVALAGAQMTAATGFTLLAMPVGGTAPVHLSAGPVIAVVLAGVALTLVRRRAPVQTSLRSEAQRESS